MVQKVLSEENSRTALTVMASNRSKSCPQYLAAFIGTLSAFCVGMCLSWSSAALLILQGHSFRVHINSQQGSWVASIITLGAFIGAIPAGTISGKIGPKRTLQVLAFPLFASWILIAYCSTVYGLYVARFLAGLAIGAISVAAPTYVAELGEARIRGSLGTLFQLQITVGLLVGYIIGELVEDFTMIALISSIVPVIYLISLSFMPESPVYLSSKGNTYQARTSLQWFRGEDFDIEEEITIINDNIKAASVNKIGISDLVTSKTTAKAMIISLGLMVFQQLSGINAVLFYADFIFEANITSISPGHCTIIIGTVQVLATYVSTVLIDRAGRRILLLVSLSVMSLCISVLGLFFILNASYTWIPLASLAIYIIVFSIGLGPIPWIMMGELFPENVKGIAVSISASFNWILAFTVTKLFHTIVDMLGIGLTFNIFGVVCLIGTAFVWFILPETKGKEIHEIMKLLGGDKHKDIENSNIDTDTIQIITKLPVANNNK